MRLLRYYEFGSFTDWVQKSAHFIVNSIKTAYTAHNQPIVCLAGGNTPIPVYRELASYLSETIDTLPSPSATIAAENQYIAQKPVLLIPGDERITSASPQQRSKRNETMLRQVFQNQLDSGKAVLISWYTGHIDCADHGTYSNTTDTESLNTIRDSSIFCNYMHNYIYRLKQYRSPLFDCVVLGVGVDGHIAGIFDANASAIHEQQLASALFIAPTEPQQRVSLLPHILRDSAATLILVHKRGKEAAITTILEGTHFLINQSISQNTAVYCYSGVSP